jgi:nicotinate phosphoribosyltransferase
MIASKANRIVNAARGAPVIEFGLRRAQGEDAALLGARASYIAGFSGTSNVKAGIEFDIPLSGTHAHSFVMSFKDELSAFRAYAKTFPNNPTLLIDTYDVEQGARNAAIVAHELQEKGFKLKAVRIDSDPLAENSDLVRKILDEENLQYVGIFATNDLNEYKINSLQGHHVSGYGVGTENITCKPVSAISGVYKLVEDEDGAKIKLSKCKKTYPGKKQVYRIFDADGLFDHDILALESETIEGAPLLEKVVENGIRVSPRRSVHEIRDYALHQVSLLPEEKRSIDSQSKYETIPSAGLVALTESLSKQFGGQ